MVSAPKLLVFDIDGVLTDGRTTISASGEESKRLNFHDLDALTALMRAGIPIAFVTGESGALAETIARRFGVTNLVTGAKDKLAAVQKLATEHSLSLADLWYVGDSDRDAPALRAVGMGLAPDNATALARSAAYRILRHEGGDGVGAEVAALVNMLLASDSVPLVDEMEKIVRVSIAAHQSLLNESLPVLSQIAQALVDALQAGHKLIVFGGGSLADTQFVVHEFARRLPVANLSDIVLALLDDSPSEEDGFARQLQTLARPGDVAVGVNSTGKSAKVLLGLEAARTLGATCVGFTSTNAKMTGVLGSKMPALCDMCFFAPAQTIPFIQELHFLAWHMIGELVARKLTGEKPRQL
ncbi:MAG: HAD family hydrolase [Chloroflexota bacterium]